MQFRVLGPLEVVGEDGGAKIGRGKRRTLLGLLLVDANTVVPHDRLIDAIWGESPPATARSALHVLVSELRKVLGAGGLDLLLTQPAGYVLRVEPAELDATLFEELLTSGREALSAGEPERAAGRLREGLALWRGAPLQDFTYEEFARAEIARLEELRTEAEEELLEAELALGRGEDLVPRLEALIARRPDRERLRGQLMLALYRAQRQTEALAAYQDARRTLVEQLGVEPSPALQRLQQAILRQDPSLESRAAPPSPPPGHPRWAERHRVLLALAAVPALGLAIGLVLALRGGGTSPPQALAAAPPRSIAVIDPETNRLVDAIPLATQPLATTPDPQGIVVGYGAVWVTDGGQQTVQRIDPEKRAIVKTIGIGADVRTLAAAFGSIWVANGSSATVTRIDARSNRAIATIPLGSLLGVPNTAFALAAGAGSVWTTAGADFVARIDPATNRVVSRTRVPAITSLAADRRFAWVGTRDGIIVRLDPRHPRIVKTRFATLPDGDFAGPMAARDNMLWVVVATGTTLLEQYDVGTGRLASTVVAGRTNSALALSREGLWVAELLDRDVVRVDPRTHKVVARIPLRRPANGIAVGAGAVWATVQS
jgi:DNA-binding SARP family transcriptional activator